MRCRSIGLFLPFLALAVLLLSNTSSHGQSTATVRGTITDSKGAVVPNATVIVRNKATSLERTTQTDGDGNYQIASLPAATYTIEVRGTGFKTQLADSVVVGVAQTIVQNFQLDVGALSEQVLVTTDVPVIESATTSVGTVINQRTVQEIPLNGRHFVDLGLLIPGSVTPPQNGFLTAPLRGQGSFGLNTAGGREDTVNFMINGINLNDMVQNQITFQPSINTVQELRQTIQLSALSTGVTPGPSSILGHVPAQTSITASFLSTYATAPWMRETSSNELFNLLRSRETSLVSILEDLLASRTLGKVVPIWLTTARIRRSSSSAMKDSVNVKD